MMESDFSLCLYLTFLALIYVASAWSLLRQQVKAIPAADEEDQELGLYCEPETLWQIIADLDEATASGRFPVQHFQVDAIVKALHKRGHVIMGPSRREVTEAAAMYQERMVS
jgi:hypothetical protein